MSEDLARCDAEISACVAYLMRGGEHEVGVYAALVDWQQERKLIEAEESK